MTDIYERGSSLQKLLSTLKLNRERVPLETLKSVYRIPYEELKAQIRESVQEFVLLVACHHLLINPNFSLDEQTAVVQAAIDRSRMPKEIGKSLTRDYDVSKIHRMALKLREEIEAALWPYIDRETCLVADLADIEKTPVIYNTFKRRILLKQFYVSGIIGTFRAALSGSIMTTPTEIGHFVSEELLPRIAPHMQMPSQSETAQQPAASPQAQ